MERGLRNMRTKDTVEKLRGLKLAANAGTWRMKSAKAMKSDKSAKANA